MWKVLSRATVLRTINYESLILARNYLSEAYYCNEVWNHRLKSPLFQRVNLDELFYELDQKFQNTKNISAVDVDIFANAITNSEEHCNELRDLVHKLRLSADCKNMLKSTSHAVTRLFLNLSKSQELLEMIDDRLNYGLFLEAYDANILMNSFIKSKEYASAARVATQLMLQEDFSHDLATKLSALSCILYLKNPTGWPEEPPPEPEPKEKTKVRVKYLRNPYFDDHFDLRKPEHLVGKTLVMIGSKGDSNFENSLRVLGLTLYEKTEKANELITKLKNENKNIFKEVLELLTEGPIKDTLLNSGIASFDGNLQNEAEKLVRNSVESNSERDINIQSELYQKWEQERLNSLEEQRIRLEKIQKLQNIEDIRKELEEKERKLWYFENEEKLELQIDANKIYYRKRWFGKKKKPRKIDEGYVPPEVITRKG
ncbi:uncharacterized protein LOC123297916 [Chrysoperla carnea]|uniref:uncharacterized protein LOC123297916 n=1 Tax=Chrysoperla carnea TaxID=189513 RepID=UPI001D0893AE|nr:uncharacterized protein LOC123297916 [Chrysoperla carnea]